MKLKLKTILMTVLLLGGGAVQAKTVVNYPTIPSKPYTGEVQSPDVPTSSDYELVNAQSGTSVGDYDVYLSLTDPANTKWPDTDEEIGSTTWSITKAANEWTTEPSIESWTYGDPASTPVAAAKFGTPTVTFSGTAQDGTTYTDVSSVAKAGTYTCKFTVAGTSNYRGLDPVVKNFEIKVATPGGGGGGGSGNVDISVAGYDGPYDGNDHQICVVITGDDAPTFTVTYSDAQEGPFKSENTYKYKEIGTYTVWYCLQSVNYATVTNSAVVKISQREITPPTIASKEYNGAMQKADVTETADYTVEYNGAFKEAGTHEDAVVLALKDKTHCKWADGAEDPVLLSFTITKSASNVWLTEPSITGWQYGEAAHIPVAVPKYGVVSVLYDGTTADGTEIKDATAVSKAGSYTAKFTVPETASYNGLSKNVAFSIERGKIDMDGGGGSGGAKIEVTNYTGTYDGDEHTAAIAVTGDESSSFILTYSLTQAGAYTAEKPSFSNACETTRIWYSVSSPDYQTITNYATVTITQAANEWTTTPAIEGWTYGETPKTPVGAAKFGTVAFTYDPTPVGDAGNYTMTASVAGTANYTGLSKDVPFTIAKKTIPSGGDEPGGGEVPPGGLSQYDVTVMYDGEEHTLDTNVLVQAFKTVVVGAFEMQYAIGNGTPVQPTGSAWGAKLPTWTNVAATSLWYKVTNPNYEDYVHQAKVTITNRCVTLTSQPKSWPYDGDWHSNTVAKCTSAYDFVAGETVSTNFTAQIRDVGTVPNAFDIAWDGSALASNYALTLVTNDLTVTAVGLTVTVTITGRVNTVVYDGAEKAVRGYDVVSISDSKYKTTDFKFTGTSEAKATNVGTYSMGLKVSDFANTNPNFSSVTFNVTDGWLKIDPAPIPFGPTVGITATGYTNAYDGAAHGVSVAAMGLKTTPTVQYKSSATADWQNASPTYTDVCDTQVWWKVSAPNYQTVEGTIGLKITQAANEWTTTPAIEGWTYGETAKTPVGAAKFGAVAFTYNPTPVANAGDYTMTASVAGTANYTGLSKDVPFTIAKKTIPGGGDEPGGGEVPPGGLSQYDVTVMYDGEEHTIDTNKIAEAFKTVIVGAFEIRYCAGGPTSVSAADATERVPPAWKDVVATSLWYKVTSPNYEDYTHQAKVTVTNRPVTLASQPKSWLYDGDWHSNMVATCASANDFVAGETVSTNFIGKIRDVGSVPNAFDIVWDGTALASNYALTLVTNDLTIAQAGAVTVTVKGHTGSATYDGSEMSVSGYDVVSISDPLYKATDFTFNGTSVKSATNAGTYPMGLKSSDFANQNPNFASVTFSVTDGSLLIAARDIANATIAPITAVEYAGVPVTPVPTVTDGHPSIITTSDYTVSYANNDAPGTATLTLTGKGNYTGTKSTNFTITSPTPKYATFTGSIAWKLNLGSGCYTAQLKLTCTNGFESGISNLRYLFADRTNGSKITASLWNSSSRVARPTTGWRDVTYRSVSLDASKITRQGASVVYGAQDVSQSKGVISSDECTIELYVPSLAVPSSYEGLVVWTSGGSDHALKISASGGATPVSEPVSAAASAQPIRATVAPVAIPMATTDELGLRNVFTSKDKTDKAVADAVLATWKGTYVMAYPEIDEDGVTNGWNTFSIKIGTRGRTIVAGILASGKSVSASAQMLVGDEWCKIAVSSTRKNATFAFTLWPSRDGDVLEAEGVEGAVIDEVGNLTGESAFKMSADDLAIVLGTDAEIALGDVLPEDVPITLKGCRWILPTAGSVRVAQKQLDYSRIKENPSALRLSFSKTTGRFMGSFKVHLWTGTKLKYVSATVKGIVVGGVGYGTAKVGKYGTMPISVEPVEAE